MGAAATHNIEYAPNPYIFCKNLNKMIGYELIYEYQSLFLSNNVFFSAPYVKVYLVDGKKCVAKAKTSTARRTLDPLYQQQLIFHERYQGCILQVCSLNLSLNSYKAFIHSFIRPK